MVATGDRGCALRPFFSGAVGMRSQQTLSAPPTGNALQSCLPLASLVWILPAAGSILGFRAGFVVWALSAVAALIETLVWTLQQIKEMRRMLGPVLRYVPFPARLTALVIVQIFFLETEIDEAVQAGSVVIKNVPTLPPMTPGKDLDGNVFDANARPKSWDPKSISVIIPCREEGAWAYRTMRSVFDATGGARKKTMLKEIVMVDDGSKTGWPLDHRIVDWERAKYRVKVIVLNKTVGPAAARNIAVEKATGDILAFIDCHTAPQKKWYEQAVTLLKENDRRVAIPHLTVLNPDKWTELWDENTHHWRSFPIWDGSLHGYSFPDSHVAVIDQSHFFIARWWFNELGGFDAGIKDEDSAQLEFSVKVWLCGGEIVTAFDSRVAHMWHNNYDPKTIQKWEFDGDGTRDHGRVIHSWWDEFAEKFEHYRSVHIREHKAERKLKKKACQTDQDCTEGHHCHDTVCEVCRPAVQEEHYKVWNAYSCEAMQADFKACTEDNLKFHDETMRACPVTCAIYRREPCPWDKAYKEPTYALDGPNPANKGESDAWFGDISSAKEVQARLHCRPFVWFLHRFRHIYEGAGLIPQKIFMIREASTHRCLRFEQYYEENHWVFGKWVKFGEEVLTNANGYANLWHCDKTDDNQYWHISNLKGFENGEDDCCSGIRVWNSDQCLRQPSHVFYTGQCKIEGDDGEQQWYLDHKKGQLRRGDMCVALGRDNTMVDLPCSQVEHTGTFWEQAHVRVPLETEYYRREKLKRPDLFRVDDGLNVGSGPCQQTMFGCFALRKRYTGLCIDTEYKWTSEPEACAEFYYLPGDNIGDPGAIRAHFRHSHFESQEDPCLDRANDANPDTHVAGPCHSGQTQDMVLVRQFGAVWFCAVDDPGSGDECLSKTKLGAPLVNGQP